FSHSKNVEEAIDAAKQVESSRYYEQQSPLSLNYATLSNALSAQLEGKPERRKLKDDRNLIKAWDKKDLICYHCQEKEYYSKECMSEKPVYQRKSDKREASYVSVFTDIPVTSSANEAHVSYSTTQDQQNDELEQVLDDYEEEELSEIEAYMADSQEEYEEETDLLPLDYNP
ncbi:13612_t:CDS:2, partial [Funneliformis caledonium]